MLLPLELVLLQRVKMRRSFSLIGTDEVQASGVKIVFKSLL